MTTKGLPCVLKSLHVPKSFHLLVGFTHDIIIVCCQLLTCQLILFSGHVNKTAPPKMLGILDISYKSKIKQMINQSFSPPCFPKYHSKIEHMDV